MNVKIHFPLVLIIAVFSTNLVHAEWVEGRGERIIGHDITQNDACDFADKKAQKDAIRKVTGENLESEDLMVCQEQKEDASCVLNRMTWSTTDGVIKGIKDKKLEIAAAFSGFQKCVVTLTADVGVAKGNPDPGFDMTVKLNHRTFRSGETLKISVTPTQPMYLTVFQWLPYEKADRQVTRIFPNEFDGETLFKGKRTGAIPTKANQSKYDMMVGFPEGLKKKLVDEYLMLVGTRKPISFKETFSFEELNTRLIEIPRSQRRTIRKAYNIVRPE